MECMKENKKRFFRKGGQNHRVQRSFDNHTGSNSCCRAPAPSPSIDSMSLANGSVTVTPVHHQQQQQQHQKLMSNPNLQQPGGGNRLVTKQTCNGSPCPPPPGGNNIQKQQQKQQQHHQALQSLHQVQHTQQHPRGNTTNSSSLDEAEINMNCHRRFNVVPRRARSAERFDGMRVAYTGGGSGELAILAQQAVAADDILSRSYRSPQILRTVEHNVGAVPGGVNSSSSSGGRRAPPAVVANAKKPLDPAIYPVPSPPPSYTTAVNDARDPPPYHQAIQAMKQPTSLRPQGKAALNNRYATSSNMGPLHHSNSVTSTPTGNHGMRSVASTPIFASIDPVCSCHKCQIAERMHDQGCGTGEYNDAVYMESQAFLMHEIMTDGMAFCSIM